MLNQEQLKKVKFERKKANYKILVFLFIVWNRRVFGIGKLYKKRAMRSVKRWNGWYNKIESFCRRVQIIAQIHYTSKLYIFYLNETSQNKHFFQTRIATSIFWIVLIKYAHSWKRMPMMFWIAMVIIQKFSIKSVMLYMSWILNSNK